MVAGWQEGQLVVNFPDGRTLRLSIWPQPDASDLFANRCGVITFNGGFSPDSLSRRASPPTSHERLRANHSERIILHGEHRRAG